MRYVAAGGGVWTLAPEQRLILRSAASAAWGNTSARMVPAACPASAEAVVIPRPPCALLRCMPTLQAGHRTSQSVGVCGTRTGLSPRCLMSDVKAPTTGAVVVAVHLVSSVLAQLRACGYLKATGRKVSTYTAPAPGADGGTPSSQRAIHMNAQGCAAVHASLVPAADTTQPASLCSGEHSDECKQPPLAVVPRGGTVPPKLLALLLDGRALWLPGYRAGACLTAALAPAAAVDTGGAGTTVKAGCSARFRYVELFAGVGGFRVALDAVGGCCVLAAEIDREARMVYAANFQPSAACSEAFSAGTHTAKTLTGDTFGLRHGQIVGDVTELSASQVPQHDVLVGGFPCQPFSVAGPQTGLDHTRGGLFQDIARLAAGCRPKVVFLENVPNLIDVNGGRAWQAFRHALRDAGFPWIAHRVVTTRAVLPQRRRRVFIVAFRADLEHCASEFTWPQVPDLHRAVAEVLVPADSDEAMAARLTPHQWQKVMGGARGCGAGVSTAVVGKERWLGSRLVDIHGQARTLRARYRSSYAVQSQFVGLEGSGDTSSPPARFFTPRECARLQGFPETFVLQSGRRGASSSRWYHQVGNSVAPPLVAAVAASVVNCLDMAAPHHGSGAGNGSGSGDDNPKPLNPAAVCVKLVLAACPVGVRTQVADRVAAAKLVDCGVEDAADEARRRRLRLGVEAVLVASCAAERAPDAKHVCAELHALMRTTHAEAATSSHRGSGELAAGRRRREDVRTTVFAMLRSVLADRPELAMRLAGSRSSEGVDCVRAAMASVGQWWQRVTDEATAGAS